MSDKDLSERKIRDGLQCPSLVSKIEIFKELDSTNRYAKELAIHGAPEGTVILAEQQSAGRGRLGRSFFSPGEKGIYMSVILRPEISLDKSVRITSMAAVAVARALERASGITARIKWVNDIFLNHKKACGILTEAGICFEKESLDYAILGIGVNVGIMEFPEEIKNIATSLGNECGIELSRNLVISEILNELTQWYPSLEEGSFMEENRKRSLLLGKEIRVLDDSEENGYYSARAVDLDDMGHLLIEREGKRIYLNSGEVSVRL